MAWLGMLPNRRQLLQLGSRAAALAALSPSVAMADSKTPAAKAAIADDDPPSDLERELKIINFDLLAEEAQKIISPRRYSFIGPAGDGITYRENRRAFDDYPIMPRRLQGVSDETVDLRVRILGQELALPIITCPTGGHFRFHVEAEVATARGTGAAGALYVSSGASNCTLEEIAAATSGPKWSQIYLNRDYGVNRWLCQRAKAAGFTAMVFTTDAHGPNMADEFLRLGSYTPPGYTFGNHDPARGGRGEFRNFKREISFDDIGFLREASGLPVVVKGVVHPKDIQQALRAGAAAIWVSNHGGRQLDGVPSSMSLLPAAVKAVNGKVPIIFDSGVRRGIDVFKALALGADVVGVGRPTLWGLINGGSLGVKSVYAFLERELRSTMMLAGTKALAEITPELVVAPSACR